jgi:hypothetical protein
VTETEIWQIAMDWIRYHGAQRNSQEQFDTNWAATKELDFWLDGQYEDLWRLILVIHSLDKLQNIMGLLAAGPIENLLGSAGEQFIDRVERMARFAQRSYLNPKPSEAPAHLYKTFAPIIVSILSHTTASFSISICGRINVRANHGYPSSATGETL